MTSKLIGQTSKIGCIACMVFSALYCSVWAQGAAVNTMSKSFLAGCRAKFEKVDEAIARAGAGYAGYQRIKGFPYLRSDRMLAAFGDRIKSFDAFDIWTYELRENDGFARNVELANMGMPDLERSNLLTDMRLCAVWLSNMELSDSDTLEKVYQGAQLPVRVAPSDPGKMRTLDRILRQQQATIKADFGAAQMPPAAAVLWRPKQLTHSLEPPRQQADPLGRIGYTPTDWQELAEKFAPSWLIETGGTFDSIGAPAWSSDGKATIDSRKHVVYYMPSYARVAGQTMVQLVYFVWFSERVSTSAVQDPLAGNIDGVIWRVTLGPSGNPLLFDFMHMSGLDQIWFVPKSVMVKDAADRNDDPVLVAASLDPKSGMAVMVHSGSHKPWRVVDSAALPQPAKVREYELAHYDDLMTLPIGGGRTRSFFDSRGIVPGTERTAMIAESGVMYAGAMRQWGNLPTAVTGRHYFDDPLLIEHLFRVQAEMEPTKQLEKPEAIIKR